MSSCYANCGVSRYVSSCTSQLEWIGHPLTRTTLVAERTVGLLHAEHVTNVIDRIRSAVDDARLPWGVVTVWGFDDSPVPCVGLKGKVSESCLGTRFTILFLPDSQCVIFQTL